MLRALLLLTLVSSAAARTCDCAQYDPRGQETETESMLWLNEFAKSVFELNKDYLYQLLVDTIENEVTDVLPGFIRSLSLSSFALTATPEVDLVTNKVTTVVCDDATFKRYILDFDLSVNNTGQLGAVDATFLFGISATITVEDVTISGILRLELLMTSEMPPPSIQNMRITFLNRPSVDFHLELGSLGVDSFGIEDWIHGMVEDAIQEQLVYPGMVFMDFSGETTKTTMISNDPTLHPAVISINITVTPVNVTQPRFSLEGWVDYGDDATKKVMLGNGANHQFDIFLENFKYPTTRVRVMERNVMRDVIWFDKTEEISNQLRAGSLKQTTTLIHREGKSSWNVTVDYWAYLLPTVQLIEDSHNKSIVVPSLYTQTNCTALGGRGRGAGESGAGDYGVLTLTLHGAANLTTGDNDLDVFVEIYMDGKKVLTTDTADRGPNPTFEVKYETLLRENTGKHLSEHAIELRVYDWDRWSSNDYIGTARVIPSTALRVRQGVTVFNDGRDRGTLLVTLLFRPVPFF